MAFPILWSRARIQAAVQAYIQTHGLFPNSAEFRAANGLPCLSTVVKLCGGYQALRRSLATAGPPPPAPRIRTCLRCDASFATAEGWHTCARCRDKGPVDDGAWMNVPVPEDYWDLADCEGDEHEQ